jgi:WD40 repeat protein
MFSNQSAEVLLNVPVRALAAVRADKVDSRFIAGSSSINTYNHLHLLRYDVESDELRQEACVMHNPGPVSQICTSPTDKSVLLTRTDDGNTATLWKIPRELMDTTNDDGNFDEDDDEYDDFPPSASMEELATLKTSNSNSKLVDMKWRGGLPSEEEESTMGDVLTLDEAGTITHWDVSLGTPTESSSSSSSSSSSRSITADVSESRWNLPPRMAWDPHGVESMAVSAGANVKLLDWRTGGGGVGAVQQSFACHRYGVADLDYNPNKPYVLATAGHDGLVKFWDLRSAKTPLFNMRGGHRHWVSQVSYNPFHDQLVLSAGTDSIVNLWRVSTISSAPLLTFDDDEADDNDNNNSETSAPNVRVSRYEHMDSCYAVAWGAADAWVYASVGYDGKVALNQVPSKEKYKILL